MDDNSKRPFHFWKLRLYTGFFLIVLSFLGLIITEVKQDGAWYFWLVLCFLFATISIGLHFFLRKQESAFYIATITHEIFHWLGLLLAVSILSIMVNIGIMGRFLSSIAVMLLLALTTYLAGIYGDITFVFVGVILGLFALGLSFVSAYLYPALIPLVVVAGGLLWFYLRKKHAYHKNNEKGAL